MPTLPPRHRPVGMPSREEAERRRKAALAKQRPSPTAQGYDGAWRKVRRLFIERHPVCCTPGCGKPTVDIDHVLPLKERPDLRLNWSNLRPFCRSCHSRRTAYQGFARPR
jgi:5-methylcytosine-specific restriction protein A